MYAPASNQNKIRITFAILFLLGWSNATTTVQLETLSEWETVQGVLGILSSKDPHYLVVIDPVPVRLLEPGDGRDGLPIFLKRGVEEPTGGANFAYNDVRGWILSGDPGDDTGITTDSGLWGIINCALMNDAIKTQGDQQVRIELQFTVRPGKEGQYELMTKLSVRASRSSVGSAQSPVQCASGRVYKDNFWVFVIVREEEYKVHYDMDPGHANLKEFQLNTVCAFWMR